MHSRSAQLALQLILLCFSASAMAETTLIDLDSAPGNFSTWRVSDLEATNVSFTATFKVLQKHEQWAPSYSIKLVDGHGNEFILSGAYQGDNIPVATATVRKDKRDVASLEPALAMTLTQTYKIIIAWTDGKATVQVDGKSSPYVIGFLPTGIEVICSTGELELKNVVFGK